MNTTLPALAARYVEAVNARDPSAFRGLFAADAHVDDGGREFDGLEAIAAWGQSDIFAPLVTMEVRGVRERDGRTVFTTKVDGNFDRTGLPDPVLIDHELEVGQGKIRELTCRLAQAG